MPNSFTNLDLSHFIGTLAASLKNYSNFVKVKTKIVDNRWPAVGFLRLTHLRSNKVVSNAVNK